MKGKQADSLIEKLLDRIDKAYPPERKRRTVQRMSSFWNGEDARDRQPYTAMVLSPDTEPPQDANQYERELISQLSAIAAHGEQWDDDYYPALSPGVRQLTLPSFFGCVEEACSDSVRVKPIIKSPEDVYRLERKGFTRETAGGEMLERMRFWRDKTNGRIAIYETDMQGPFSVASQIWGIEDFLLALYDYPDEATELVRLCTGIFIDYVYRMREAAGGQLIPFHCQPCLWYPADKGVALSEDLVAVISAGLVEQFMRPALERIAREFGGVVVHTCGSMNHVIPALCRVEGIAGLNFSSSETDVRAAVSQKANGVKIVCHNSPVRTGELAILPPMEHARLLGSLLREHGETAYCILLNIDNSMTPSEDEKIREMLSL